MLRCAINGTDVTPEDVPGHPRKAVS